MGVVYEAVQLSLNRRVALKVLPIRGGDGPDPAPRGSRPRPWPPPSSTTRTSSRSIPWAASAASITTRCSSSRGRRWPRRSPSERGQPETAPAFPLDGGRWPEGRMRGPSPTVAEPDERRPARRGLPTPPRPTTGGLQSTSIAADAAASRLELIASESVVPQPGVLPHGRRRWASRRPRRSTTPTRSASCTATSSRPTCLLDVQGNLWVTDFGLARLRDDTGLTMTGDLLGTLRYMSPEQALAKRMVIDHRTDIYSLGRRSTSC